MTEYKVLLKNKNFVLLWTSQVLSQFAINLLNFIIITSLYKTTGSAIAISLVWIFYAIPVLILGPFASASVDMYDKKKILIATNLLQSLVIFFFAFGIDINIFLLYSLVFIYSLLNQFYIPSELAAVPYLVNKQNLPQANSLFFMTHQGAIVFGFGFASILLGFVDFKTSLYIGSLLLFIAFISVSLISGAELESKKKDFEKSFSHFFWHIIEGYKHIKKDKYILAPLGLIIGLQVAMAMGYTNLPIFAEDLLSVPIEYAGLLIVVPASLGAGLSAVVIPKILKSKRKIWVIRHSLQIIVLSLLLFNFSTDIFRELGYLAIVLLGFAYIGILIPSQTFLQEQTPEKLRGRVFGNLWLLTTLFTIVPLILSASLVELLGVRILIFVVGAVALSVYIFLHRYGEKIMYNSNHTPPK